MRINNAEQHHERQQERDDGQAPRGYRSGVAARLAGLGAATLRVWERRYQLTAAPRSANGQRLYTQEQVRRLGLLKQLVDQGHPIGSLAALPLERLLAMAGGVQGALRGGGAGANGGDGSVAVIEVAAIGAGLLRRLAGAIDEGLPLRLPRAGEALRAPAVLLVELAEPDDGALAFLRAARSDTGAAAVVVLYRFCASATVRALRADGFMVARFPGEMAELPLLCRAALQRGQVAPLRPAAVARFDDVALAAIGAGGGFGGGSGDSGGASANDAGSRQDSARALAEMLRNLASFERYSARCAANEPDAGLHRDLEDVAGRARVLLEQALATLLSARR